MNTPQTTLMRSNIFTLSVVSFVLLFLFTNLYAQTVEARLVSTPKPEIPEAAKKTGIGGKVLVLIALDETGKVTEVRSAYGPDSVCSTITYPDVVALREAARAAALKAKFAPATQDGKPVASTIFVSYDFKGSTIKDSEVLRIGAVEEKNQEPPKEKSEANSVLRELRLSRVSSTDASLPPTPRNTSAGTGKTISGGVLNGKAMDLPKPPYPPAARAVRATGAVSVQVLIDTDGYVYSAQALSGHPLLRPASVIAACNSRFTPTLLMGEPVKVSGIITYNFVP